ncbi:LysR family transcriptional regulator [Catenuloplanes atrovinosus]|uniref:DNA-binding transcriptional LysR family regulator n=1 Tax=Catenuloplanes atrovinosus TaxID=137266 RepID=A0AAE3YM84_9ACTN|nr:LysR family transcriptional regulator [Catenuloplanes atrovinosus]MDR7275617.1 DNA-binding transcriptional LysR family regulator [Catenuloplanes atrovinosus]
MGEVEIRQVGYFVAVAEELNFTRAAQRLNMTQPALSRAVRAVERSVGGPLLTRTAQGLTLTPAGQVMLTEGRALLSQSAHLLARVRGATRPRGPLTVTSPGCDAFLLDRLVRSYNDTGPDLPAEAAVGTFHDQFERLGDGRADLALWRGIPPAEGLHGLVVRYERVNALVGAAHRLARQDGVTLADLAGEQVVTWAAAGPSDPLIDPRLWPDGVPGASGPRVVDGLQMLAVVRLGHAIALTVATHDATPAPEGTVRVPLRDGPRLPLRLLWSRSRDAEHVRRFARHAASTMRDGQPARAARASS